MYNLIASLVGFGCFTILFMKYGIRYL